MAAPGQTLPDWNVGAVHEPLAKRVGLLAALVAPILLISICVSLLSGGPDLGFIAFFTLSLLVFLVAAWRADSRGSLRALRPEPLDHDRFTNVVEGMADRIGVAKPRLLEVEAAGPNALVFGLRRPAIGVTRELLQTFSRTEQEAVAAHCLLRIRSGRVWMAHAAAMLGRTGSRFAPRVGEQDDVHVAALTRYPPALASAIAKAKPNESATAPFWFVAYGESHRHPEERIADLQDL